MASDSAFQQCDNCGSADIELGVTVIYPGLHPAEPAEKAGEGQWYRCKKCGRRWFIPAGLLP